MRTAYILFVPLVSLPLVQQVYAEDQSDRERYGIVSKYHKLSLTDASALMVSDNPKQAFEAASDFTIKTDNTFSQLGKLRLLDNKMVVYQEHWSSSLKPALKNNPRDTGTVFKVGLFRSEIEKAAQGGNCTIVITASNGEGAFVHYAKAQDADLGRSYKQLPGTTTIIQELERAEYKFKSIREGRQTGKTDIVACTDSKTPVKLVISEQ